MSNQEGYPFLSDIETTNDAKSQNDIKSKLQNKSLDESLGLIGGFGKFQWLVAISFVLGHITGPMIVNGLTFLTNDVQYEC